MFYLFTKFSKVHWELKKLLLVFVQQALQENLAAGQLLSSAQLPPRTAGDKTKQIQPWKSHLQNSLIISLFWRINMSRKLQWGDSWVTYARRLSINLFICVKLFIKIKCSSSRKTWAKLKINKTREKREFALHPHSNIRQQPNPFSWLGFCQGDRLCYTIIHLETAIPTGFRHGPG